MNPDLLANAALDAMWGDSHGASMPLTFEVALVVGDPRQVTPVELDYPGYARATGSNANTFWDAATGRVKASKPVTFPDATGPATVGAATHWAIYLPGAFMGDEFDSGQLADPINVDAAGPVSLIKIRRPFSTGLV